MMIISHRLHTRLFIRLNKGGLRAQSNTCFMVEMRQKNSKKGQQGPSHTFNSDGSKVLDRGVWKEYKYCKECKRIMVMRKSWEKNWDSVSLCSDKCRKAVRSKKDSTAD